MSLIRVVSYNIHKGRSALGRRESLNDLRLGLYGLRPDLVFLQEVQGRNEVSSVLHAQHESLAAALCLQAAYGRNAIRTGTDHGNALLSRFDIPRSREPGHLRPSSGATRPAARAHRRRRHRGALLRRAPGLVRRQSCRQIQALTDRIRQSVGRRAAADRGRLQRLGRPPGADVRAAAGPVRSKFSHAPRSHGGDRRACATRSRRLGNVLRGVPNSVAVLERNNQLGMGGALLSPAAAADFPGGVPVVPPGSHLPTRLRVRSAASCAWARVGAPVGSFAAAGRARIAVKGQIVGCTGPMAIHHRLLQNGGDFFPALCEAIDAARVPCRCASGDHHVFLLDRPGGGCSDAWRRCPPGVVKVRVVLDGFGSAGT